MVSQYLDFADDSVVAVLPHALRIALAAGLFDELAEGPLWIDELCRRTGTDERSVRRMLRALGTVGLVRTVPPGRAELADPGQRLLEDARGGSRAAVSHVDSEIAWLAASSILDTGRPSFSGPHGDAFFEHKNNDEIAGACFRARMRDRAVRLYGDLAGHLAWPSAGTVMDIGGGDGTVLAGVLDAAPGLRGILFDIAATTAPHERCTVVRDDFFSEVPAGADTHLMCSVLHDWPDDDALRILRNSRRALTDDGRLLIVEMLVPDDGRWHPAVWSDLSMMALTGGQERTEGEFDALLAAAGYRLTGTTPISGTWFHVIEAR
jgi:hypothetical protein